MMGYSNIITFFSENVHAKRRLSHQLLCIIWYVLQADVS